MLRLQTKLTRGDPYRDVILDPAVQAELFKLDVCCGQSGKPDAILECAQACQLPAPNTIVFDRTDGQEPACPQLLSNENVIGYVKPQIWADAHPKMKAGPSYLHYHRMKPFVDWVDDGRERDIDVSFAGCSYKHQPESKAHKHRSEFLNELGEISQHSNLNMVIVVDSRAYWGDRYLDLLSRSKVVVSPWGHGEICFRDFEALLMGCAVLKPLPRTVIKIQPDLFGHPLHCNFIYVWDWSHLKEDLSDALVRYEGLRLTNGPAFVKSQASPAVVARNLIETIKECLNGNHGS